MATNRFCETSRAHRAPRDIFGAGDLAFALKDSAELLVGRPDATGFQVLKTYTVADSSTWAQPVLAGNRIFVKDETKVTLFTFN